MSNAVWGVAIGSDALRAVRLERNAAAESLQCTHRYSEPYPSYEDILAEAEFLLEELAFEINANPAPVVISMPASTILSRVITIPDVEHRQDEILEFELRQILPFPLDGVVWRVEAGKRDSGNANFVAHVMKKSQMELIANCMQRLKLNVIGVVPEFIGVRAFLRYDLEAKPPYATLYNGEKSAELCVMSDLEETVHRIWTGLGTEQKDTFANVVGQKLLHLCASQKLARPETLYLIGKEVQAAARTTSNRLKGVAVAPITQLKRIAIAGSSAKEIADEVPELAAAVGVGVLGLFGVPQSLNFIRPPKRDWSKAAMLAGGAVAGIVCMLAIIGVIADEPQRPAPPISQKPPKTSVARQSRTQAPPAVPPSQFNTAQSETYGRVLQEFLNSADCRGVMVARTDGALLAKRGYSFSFNSDSKAGEWIVSEIAKSRQPKALGHVIALSNSGESAMLHTLRDGQVLVAIFDNSRNDSALLESVMILKQKLLALPANDAKR